MIVAVPVGLIVKLVTALIVALVMIVMLLASRGTQDAPGPADPPPTGNFRAER